jgi:2-oxoglutarate dehydrogenase complex dehydrogenase (E1) component-like enzyme
VISRKPSASPASGFKKVSDEQQQEIVDKSFGAA